jgi:hypothetical protein
VAISRQNRDATLRTGQYSISVAPGLPSANWSCQSCQLHLTERRSWSRTDWAIVTGSIGACLPTCRLRCCSTSALSSHLHKWTGLEFFHPPHGQDSARKALRWAVSSTYESKPTLNIGVLVCPPGTKLRLMGNERVQVLLHLKHRRHRPPLTEADWYINMRMQYKMPKTHGSCSLLQ